MQFRAKRLLSKKVKNHTFRKNDIVQHFFQFHGIEKYKVGKKCQMGFSHVFVQKDFITMNSYIGIGFSKPCSSAIKHCCSGIHI